MFLENAGGQAMLTKLPKRATDGPQNRRQKSRWTDCVAREVRRAGEEEERRKGKISHGVEAMLHKVMLAPTHAAKSCFKTSQPVTNHISTDVKNVELTLRRFFWGKLRIIFCWMIISSYILLEYSCYTCTNIQTTLNNLRRVTPDLTTWAEILLQGSDDFVTLTLLILYLWFALLCIL